MISDKIMRPGNARWPEFCDKLVGPKWKDAPFIRCNGVLTFADGSIRDESFAVRILKEMDMDVKASVAFFEEHGGYCDCEIIYNVEENL